MESNTTKSVPKSTEKKRNYCSVCSNFRGKFVEDQCIILHKFPSDIKLRRMWVQRVKLVMKSFKLGPHSRICSAHFVNGRMTPENNIPSVFMINSKKKLFGSSVKKEEGLSVLKNSSDVAGVSSNELSVDTAEYTATLLNPDTQNDIDSHSLVTDYSIEHVSVLLHDYDGSVDVETLTWEVNKDQQTDESFPLVEMKTSESQTKCSVNSKLSQTEKELPKETVDVGIQCTLPDITFSDLKNNDSKVMLYTGLPDAKTFIAMFEEMEEMEEQATKSESGIKIGRPRKLIAIDEFLLVLMRLRMGLIVEDLAYRFKISKSTCSTIINVWIDYLNEKLSPLLTWPSKDVIANTMPTKFKETYSKTRVIVDCTELYTETPQSLVNRSLMYSHYKSHMTYKALLGISPSGLITYVSELWAGSISDKQIIRACGILDLCERGDAIMADKGFQIADLTTPRGLHLIIPPLKIQRFTRRQVEETRRIANLRIYVEMAMERVKNFRILHGVIPITMTKKLSKIWKMCASLSNLKPPLILDD